MKQVYAIYDMVSSMWWYGNYTNQKWTASFGAAKLFDSEQEAIDCVTSNMDEFKGCFLTIQEIINP